MSLRSRGQAEGTVHKSAPQTERSRFEVKQARTQKKKTSCRCGALMRTSRSCRHRHRSPRFRHVFCALSCVSVCVSLSLRLCLKRARIDSWGDPAFPLPPPAQAARSPALFSSSCYPSHLCSLRSLSPDRMACASVCACTCAQREQKSAREAPTCSRGARPGENGNHRVFVVTFEGRQRPPYRRGVRVCSKERWGWKAA